MKLKPGALHLHCPECGGLTQSGHDAKCAAGHHMVVMRTGPLKGMVWEVEE